MRNSKLYGYVSVVVLRVPDIGGGHGGVGAASVREVAHGAAVELDGHRCLNSERHHDH